MTKKYKKLADAIIESSLKEDVNYLWTEDGKFWTKYS